MSVIVIGAAATNRSNGASAGYTFIDKDGPANFSGIITSVDVWAYANITGLIIGTFYLVSGSTYQCRASAALGSVTAGSKVTFSGLSLGVVAGDLLGSYVSTGALSFNVTGGSGILYYNGNKISPGNSAAYTTQAGYIISTYGQGVTPAGISPNFLPFFWA